MSDYFFVFLGVFEFIIDESKVGVCLWIINCRGLEYWLILMEWVKYLVGLIFIKKIFFKVILNIKFF